MRRIAGATTVVAVAALVARGLGVFKELAVAFVFGTGHQLDAFLIAIILPTTALSMVTSATQASLLPVYIQTAERAGREAADRLIANALFVLLALVSAVAVTLAIAAAPILHLVAGRQLADDPLVRSLFLMLVPLPVLGACAGVWTAALNADERFAVPSVVPAVSAVVIGLSVVVLGRAWGAYALATATLLGVALEACVLGVYARRSGVRVRPRWSGWTPELQATAKQFLPMLAGTMLMTCTMLVDQAVAARLPAGSVATLAYGSRLTGFIVAIASLALGTAVFPHFSRMLANGQPRQVASVFRTCNRLVFAGGLALALLVAFVSHDLIAVLFQRGAFSERDTTAAAHVQTLFVLQVPFYLIGIMAARLLNALGRSDRLLQIASFNMVLNLVGDIVLSRYLGVPGIALATSIVYAVACGFMLLAVRHAMGKLSIA